MSSNGMGPKDRIQCSTARTKAIVLDDNNVAICMPIAYAYVLGIIARIFGDTLDDQMESRPIVTELTDAFLTLVTVTRDGQVPPGLLREFLLTMTRDGRVPPGLLRELCLLVTTFNETESATDPNEFDWGD